MEGRRIAVTGIGVVALADGRALTDARPGLLRLRSAGVELLGKAAPLAAAGRGSVEGLRLTTSTGERTIDCDLVAMAMLWNGRWKT